MVRKAPRRILTEHIAKPLSRLLTRIYHHEPFDSPQTVRSQRKQIPEKRIGCGTGVANHDDELGTLELRRGLPPDVCEFLVLARLRPRWRNDVGLDGLGFPPSIGLEFGSHR